ncbi:MAG: leucine--tRNA ligase, partial [Candidatus Goldbacteria bacterium]|nr:leucine--tRNA ligase [Candidatus Goldiibacteriota bacterium]
ILMQKNWIGRSEGVRIYFKEERTGEVIPVFTTRPDTIFGATYVVLAAQHPFIDKIKKLVPEKKVKDIEKFQEKVKKSDITVDTIINMEKEGIETGVYAINPVNNTRIPIWIGNYVLMEYGTGAIMAVPAHDSRDFAFAKKYGLPIVIVIQPEGEILNPNTMKDAYEGRGKLINSEQFNGIDNEEAKKRIGEWMEKTGIGKMEVNYKLKDWLISRQRYWGTPIPAIYCDKCGIVMEKEENLPVILPYDIEFTGKGNPLTTSKTFLKTKCPNCGADAKRETDTMDTFVDSSWYFIRYCDPKNKDKCVDKTIADKELPVDQYVGGPEHACMHLIYARFFTKVMRDLGLISCNEPFKKLLTQGMVIKDGNKMSKSKGNTVSPDDLIEKYGADTARLFMLFASPPPLDLEWNDEGVEGSFRFLNRVWRKVLNLIEKIGENIEIKNLEPDMDELDADGRRLLRKVHQTIKKVTNDIEVEQQFNTAIAAIMELFNVLNDIEFDFEKIQNKKVVFFAIKNLILMLAPIVPHFAEELWQKIGFKSSIFKYKWPEYKEEWTIEDEIEFVIQVSGKIRDRIKVRLNITQEEIEKIAFESNKIKEWLKGKEIVRKIFVPNKLLNIVVK